jgi:hypothetical protein
LSLFSRGSHHKPNKHGSQFQIEDIGITITSAKNHRHSVFQIEDIGIIFESFPSQAKKKGNPVFK